jgi:hypothetical protein
MTRNARADRTGGGALVLYQQFKFVKKSLCKFEVKREFEPVPFLMDVIGQIYSPSALPPWAGTSVRIE